MAWRSVATILRGQIVHKQWLTSLAGHDHTCKSCQRGLFQMCEHEAVNGVTMDGGYAEYVLLRTEAVVRVPTDVNPVEYAPILCAGITVFNSIRKQNILLGELVAVQGLGGLGHLAIQCELICALGIACGLLILPV